MKKKISIITVTKNSEKYLEKNILSVHKQKYKNYEHIIIDGKSTDKTIDIINKHKKKIKYFISEKDKGLYDAMNKGIKRSNGDIIGILNSDDIYYKKTLEIVNKYFNKYKKLDFLFGSVYKHKLLHGYYPKKIKWTFGFYSTHSIGFFIKKEAHKKVGFYNIKYKYSADYDLFYRLIVKKKMNGIATRKSEVFGKFRRGGLSSRIRYIDFLKECSQIRLDNKQNFFLVYLIFFARLIKNFRKILL
ncbi:glycosyltransferase [Candidatus Pelagibacter ubique]|nr:glycosyltransferase [Candidatus Pelagibacter ubique]